MLQDPDKSVRARALWALGGVQGLAAGEIDKIVAAAGDSDPTVRHSAVRALGEIGEANQAIPAATKARIAAAVMLMPLAVRAQVKGVVILEAVVARDGSIEDVRVLRSIPLLDSAAVAAVRKWRYSPLLLNGKPERFVLTVTVSFSLTT